MVSAFHKFYLKKFHFKKYFRSLQALRFASFRMRASWFLGYQVTGDRVSYWEI
jgi:hypothetical protein